MKMFRFAALFSVVTISSVSAAQYQAVILHPSTGFNFTEVWASDNGQQGGQGQTLPGYEQHALLWSNSIGSLVDLHPSGLGVSSWAYGVGDGQQGGYVQGFDGRAHAALWSGTAASAVLLDTGLGGFDSYVFGIGGGQQVGDINFGGITGVHAALWTGTPASFVDLNPSGASGSSAYSAAGGQQVGFAVIGGVEYPALWTGSASSFVNMAPSALQGRLVATDGVQQVGWTDAGAALLWNGVPNVFINLKPAEYWYAAANDVANGKQCGFGYGENTSWNYHALAWSGTAGTCVDLHQFIPQDNPYGDGPFYTQSIARGVAPDGTIAGTAYTAGGQAHAILWIPTGPPLVFGGFLQPINDPATPESVFKKGSTVPVKFKLTSGGQPAAGEEAHISLTQLGAEESPVNEALYTTPADEGTLFRFNSGAGAYVYNLGTKNLVAGRRYRITATWSTGSASVTISIR